MGESTALLRELARHGPSRIAADLTKAYAFERAVQLAIQCILDIGAHFISSLGARSMDDLKQIGPKLAELGVIPASLGENLRGMAGARNLLVHEYLAVALERLVETTIEHLDDFDEFALHISRFLRRQSEQDER